MSKRHKAKRRARYYRKQENLGLREPPCWCGVRNPYFAPLDGNCGGTGEIECHCGGDLCVCHNHGGGECFGCADCDQNGDHEDDEPDDNYDDQP